MITLSMLLCALAFSTDPPPVEPLPAPAAPSDREEATPAEPPLAGPPAAAPPASRFYDVTSAGIEVLAPRPRPGRRFEQPISVVFDAEQLLGGPITGGLHGAAGYAQLDRTHACELELSFCRPLLGVSLGGLLRAGTPPRRLVAGWIAVGAGVTAALNWEVNVLGVYARADAGVDLRPGGRRIRLAVGWVEAAFTETRSEYEPGRQRYLAFTVMAWSP